MTAGSKVGPQGCVPLEGESTIKQQTAATDLLTLEGAASQSGDFLVCRNSSQTEKLSVDSNGRINLMALGTVALASAASNAGTQSVSVSGLTTDMMVMIFAKASGLLPNVYVGAADKLYYNPPGALGATAAMTVNYWAFKTV